MLLASCALPGTTPGPVRPTLDAITALGLECDSGVPDNVPSGLSQWHCRGTVDGISDFIILVGGSEAGVAQIDVVSPTDDPAIARAALARVVVATPPISGVSGLATDIDGALQDWDGAQMFLQIRGLNIAAQCQPPSKFGAGQCLITFVGPDPIKPMLR
jgi:hypothetical protein